jgi:CRP/FNR family transcriptional regulator, cyclic AMP receptor protein
VVPLLRLDPELAEDLSQEQAALAMHELVVRVEELRWKQRDGRWGPRDATRFFGFLVVGGLLLREVDLGGSFSAELLGAEDLLRPFDIDGLQVLPAGGAAVRWTVLWRVDLAVLDGRFLEAAGRFPSVLSRLSGRAVLRAKAALLNQAISHAKHVDSRLLLLFWHLAERWGRRRPGGITLDLPLTHALLARLVGATRPSVTGALGRLARAGLLSRAEGGWWLSPDACDHVPELRRGHPDDTEGSSFGAAR